MAKRTFTKYPSGYVKASNWYDPENPNWTIEDEKDMYFEDHSLRTYTAEDWAYLIGKKLGLPYYEYTMLLDDLNNLRGGEWVDSAAEVLDEHELACFKRFVHYFDAEQDNFYGYEEGEL